MGTGDLVKPRIGSKIIRFTKVLARLRKFGWGTPAEGMTKVIPALSCKHDNEETRSGSDGYLARRRSCKQRGGFPIAGALCRHRGSCLC